MRLVCEVRKRGKLNGSGFGSGGSLRPVERSAVAALMRSPEELRRRWLLLRKLHRHLDRLSQEKHRTKAVILDRDIQMTI